VALRGIAFDSMVGSFLLDAARSSHGLDALAEGLLAHTNIPIDALIGHGPQQRTFDTAPLNLATQYAAEDADVALRLRALMLPQLDAAGLLELAAKVEMPLVDVLAELEFNGIRVDPVELDRQRERLLGTIAELKGKIDDAAMESIGRTFNPDSPKQLAAALFGKPGDVEPGLGLKPVKRTKTGFSTDVEVLEKLAGDPTVATPIPALIVDYRQLTKLVSTYLVALKEAINPKTGRVHASFNQTVAVTGRLASSDPNLQNIPIRTDAGREVRRAFVAEPGHVFVSADYSQIELRILAHLSRDPALIEAFHQGEDIHTAVAAQINGVPVKDVTKAQRSGAKMVNFGIVYGITAFGLARRLGIENDAAAAIIDGYKRRFAGITTFLEECVDQARRHGYVETMLKRRRPIPEIASNVPAVRSFGERTAINSVVQGSAADLIKLAMVELHARSASDRPAKGADAPRKPALPKGCRMLLQIHDELVFECPEAEAEQARQLIVETMERAMTLSVPIKADSSIAATWFDGK
jgi:DNA polymerase-1